MVVGEEGKRRGKCLVGMLWSKDERGEWDGERGRGKLEGQVDRVVVVGGKTKAKGSARDKRPEQEGGITAKTPASRPVPSTRGAGGFDLGYIWAHRPPSYYSVPHHAEEKTFIDSKQQEREKREELLTRGDLCRSFFARLPTQPSVFFSFSLLLKAMQRVDCLGLPESVWKSLRNGIQRPRKHVVPKAAFSLPSEPSFRALSQCLSLPTRKKKAALPQWNDQGKIYTLVTNPSFCRTRLAWKKGRI